MTFTTSIERAPDAAFTRESPLYVKVRDGADRVAAWVDKEDPYAYTALGYTLVRPTDVERMEGGQYFPREKDFGMYRDFEKGATEVRTGRMVLMSTSRTDRDARQDREMKRLASTNVRKTDKDEKTDVQEADSTLAKELQLK